MKTITKYLSDCGQEFSTQEEAERQDQIHYLVHFLGSHPDLPYISNLENICAAILKEFNLVHK